MAERKLITLRELQQALTEAERKGIPRSKIDVIVLDDRVDISPPENPGKTVFGVAFGAIIQKVEFGGYNVRLEKTSQRPYL